MSVWILEQKRFMNKNCIEDLEAGKIRHNKFWNHLFHKNVLSFFCIISRLLWQMCYTCKTQCWISTLSVMHTKTYWDSKIKKIHHVFKKHTNTLIFKNNRSKSEKIF